ncbi:ankyrin repeat family A protein 2-like [Neocloeon triangulifer]|uniref:ankyrin repeat family A protein 2-like n=1 Tax=Neocloeon triangulifer TaxID=2078957 RepID=UPI00286F8B1E|nr:ankyrin repeat family A protein 2-like [Neocloeon triangulifer]
MDDDSSADSKGGRESQTSGCESLAGEGKSGDEEGRSSKTRLPTWSGSLWHDGNRKSAFQPYRQQTTILTNLQRGNTQTLTPVLEPVDVSIHHRAGQGELTEDDFVEEIDVDEEDAFGLTPLHWASSYGQLPTVQLLLQKGASINKQGKEGETALHLAASGGHHDTLKVLLSEGAKVDEIDENSNTALMYSAHSDHPHCVNELLLRGADITLKNINNDTALGIAINRSSSQAQAVIENHIISLLTLIK